MAAVPVTTYLEAYRAYPAANLALFNTIFEGGAAPSPALRLNQFLSSSDDTAKVLVYLGGTPASPQVMFVHGVFKFAPSMAGPTQWDDQVFGLHDDITGGNRSVTPLVLPNGILNRTGGTHVPTTAMMGAAWTAALATDAAAVGLGPYAGGDANTEAVNTRFVTGIPNQYVELVMNHQGRTPHSFWNEVVDQVLADGNEVPCSALVNWARVACSFSAANANVLLGHAPQPFVPDLAFRQRLNAKLERDVPVAAGGGAPTRSRTQPLKRSPTSVLCRRPRWVRKRSKKRRRGCTRFCANS